MSKEEFKLLVSRSTKGSTQSKEAGGGVRGGKKEKRWARKVSSLQLPRPSQTISKVNWKAEEDRGKKR